jgi:2-phosphoglycerate kinase
VARGNWQILLIGGPSAAGKSTLARALAEHYGLVHLDADLFFLTLRRAFPRDIALPGLKQEDELFWSQPPDVLVEHYMRLSAFVCNALEAVIALQYRRHQPSVLEGGWLLPSFARQEVFDGVAMPSGAVRGLFLYEDDTEELERRRQARGDAWARTFKDEVMLNIREMRRRHGIVLKEQAQSLGEPTLASRPLETLFDRALAALEG